MPELPDVEVFRQYLNRTALHQKIESINIYRPEILEAISAEDFTRELKGKQFESSHRHGKYLFVKPDDGNWLTAHFGMTGFLRYFKNPEEEHKHTRVRFDFVNGYHLAYVNMRMLGGLGLTNDPGSYSKEKALGPDAMDEAFDFSTFKQALQNRRGAVKNTLMNQEVMSGIGNVYSDELLFQTQIHPRTEVSSLNEEMLQNLYQTMKKTLQTAIDHQAEPDQFPEDYLTYHRHGDNLCPRCGDTLEKIKVAGRTARFCSKCQPGGIE